MNVATFKPMSRRTFLRAAGVSMALPFLDSMLPRALAAGAGAPPRRMVCINTPLGLHAPFCFPEKTGRDYDSTPYLDKLQAHRNDFTVFSGLALEGNEAAGHGGGMTFLTGAVHPEQPGFHNSISIDQLYADQVGIATRFPSLVLGVDGGPSISF